MRVIIKATNERAYRLGLERRALRRRVAAAATFEGPCYPLDSLSGEPTEAILAYRPALREGVLLEPGRLSTELVSVELDGFERHTVELFDGNRSLDEIAARAAERVAPELVDDPLGATLAVVELLGKHDLLATGTQAVHS